MIGAGGYRVGRGKSRPDEDERMTPREQFINALEIGPPAERCPTFELVFFLTMEALGKVFPGHRRFTQWDQMSDAEKKLQVADAAQVFIDTAERYDHDAIFVHGFGAPADSLALIAREIRERTGRRFFLCRHGDATYSIPNGDRMVEFAFRMADDAEGMHREATEQVDRALAGSEAEMDDGLWDGFALCADYCFNTGPFMSPDQFGEFVTPYLKRLVAGYRDQGFYTIKHTDGDIMPILDQLAECRPHALHSIDPQAGVDIAEVKRRIGHEICLIGNVNCGLIQTGTEDQVAESARYALRHGMPGGGYIFGTSNCVYTGMPLERYELINRIWRDEGRYETGGRASRRNQDER
jgi:uroporphyrinogen decarboxylase